MFKTTTLGVLPQLDLPLVGVPALVLEDPTGQSCSDVDQVHRPSLYRQRLHTRIQSCPSC